MTPFVRELEAMSKAGALILMLICLLLKLRKQDVRVAVKLALWVNGSVAGSGIVSVRNHEVEIPNV